MRFPIAGRNSDGMDPFNSMVKYEIQRRASNWKGLVIALVGQAVIQRLQEPHRFFSALSGDNSNVVMISLRKIQFPNFRLIRLVCLPTKPSPDRWARSRSNNGPVSTYQSDLTPGPPNSVSTLTNSLSRSPRMS